MNERIAKRVRNLFRQIDKKVMSFQVEASLRCPRCAGHCCKNNYIEVTPLDVLPVVLQLERSNKLKRLLEKLDRDFETCAFYSKRQTEMKNCHCSAYLLRPTTCRMFGFGARKDKYGSVMLATCKLQKGRYYEQIKVIESDKRFRKKVLFYSDIAMKLYDIDAMWGSMRMHINDAIKLVAEKVLLLKSFDGRMTGRNNHPKKVA